MRLLGFNGTINETEILSMQPIVFNASCAEPLTDPSEQVEDANAIDEKTSTNTTATDKTASN